MGDEIILQNIWAVLTQDAKTGTWTIRSVHKSQMAADAACDRETLRVVELECHQPGVPAAFAMGCRDGERTRIVCYIREVIEAMRRNNDTRYGALEEVLDGLDAYEDRQRGEHDEKANA